MDTAIPRLSLTPAELAQSAGVGRTRVFQAIRDGELEARKAGSRTTLIELVEAQRWIRSLPIRGRRPDTSELHAL
jgi:hypothetical protein